MSVVIETTIGDITVDLFTDERPVACHNFMKLCKLKYYNFNLFHTIEQGFIAQTGDPTGVGDGGSSVWGVLEGKHKRFFEAETLPKIHHTEAGLLSLVSAGKNMVGSQFIFSLGENLTSLDGIHCVIGEVVEGHEILRKLNEAIVDEKFRPYQDIRITHTVILNDPFPDPRGFQIPSRSPSPNPINLQNGRIAADEDIDDTDGKTVEEIQELLANREAKARATILEIVGDLPDAEMAPPENVLFVCKLNSVTTDDDLEIIFSRFGKVKSCEVIRDKKSGDSLQYAFVEFEDQKACENAFFKMDNVLIDDRRIHVDFSQSVSKVKWHGKGRGVEGPEGRLDFNNLRDVDKKHTQHNSMTTEERRKAREERHRAQDEEEQKRRRNRSRSLSRHSRDDRLYNNRRQNNERNLYKQLNRRDEMSSRRGHEYRRDERRRYSRSRSRDRIRKSSPYKRISPVRNAKRVQQNSSAINRSRYQNDQRRRDREEYKDKSNLSNQKENTKNKRKNYTTSSDSENDSDTDADSSTNNSSASTSSSEKERKKKKKNKTKKSKSKKSKKSKKKHKK